MALTSEQQKVLGTAVDKIGRPLFLGFAKQMNNLRILNDAWNDGLKDLVDAMDANEVLPNESDLADAEDLTKEEILTLFAALQHVLALDTKGSKTLSRKIGGITALVGR